jgi:hypothetical protein
MKLITLLSSACTLAAPNLAYLHIYGNIASDPFVGASVWSIFAVDDGQIVCISDMSSRINQDSYFSTGLSPRLCLYFHERWQNGTVCQSCSGIAVGLGESSR